MRLLRRKGEGKFLVFRDIEGFWRWSLVSGNGEKVAASEGYARKADARRAAKATIRLAGNATITEVE